MARRAVLALPLFVTLILAQSCGVHIHVSARHGSSKRIASLHKQVEVLPLECMLLTETGHGEWVLSNPHVRIYRLD